ncbi:MAG: 16S rRNA (guanine(527)-N(7))-methyltransferase RsmG [Gammaproteobacteria bacterium]|nr:16S rRNA (guanine(527)-N(7))-methyltransferase RsmG [Gammaproteobacteria bacterium]
MDDAHLQSILNAGLDKLDHLLPGDAAAALLQFIRLLNKWNKTWNLTAVRNPVDMVPRHVLDSLSIRPWLEGARIADVGSGAGLPGIPLAIAEPGRQFVLIDSAVKRTRFITQAAATLGLSNVEVIHSRAEDYRPESGFDTVISRAFASLADFAAAAGHLATPDGCLLAMKGRYPGDEIAQLPATWQPEKVESLTVPNLVAERHVVVLRAAMYRDG